MKAMTLEVLLSKEEDSKLLAIYKEIESCVIPATGAAHEYVRNVNKMIDRGTVCVREDSYRKIYTPTLARAVLKEMARRYCNYCFNKK